MMEVLILRGAFQEIEELIWSDNYSVQLLAAAIMDDLNEKLERPLSKKVQNLIAAIKNSEEKIYHISGCTYSEVTTYEQTINELSLKLEIEWWLDRISPIRNR